ncbi:MAG: 6-bladed beta-propeller [Solirubrobacterales bacterium]
MLLLACTAVPVFGAEQPEPPSEPPPGEQESQPLAPPNGDQIAAEINAIEQREASRDQELKQPWAVEERAQSREAYVGLSGEDARQLLLTSFPEQLARLDADPARLLDNVKVEKVFEDETVATVSEDGQGSLLEAGIPIRTEDDAGDLKKVDLDLERTEGGFEPQNPLTDVSIPDSATEPISVGEEGLAITAVGASGEAQPVDDDAVIYPEAQTDTDLFVAPTAAGVELFDQLRSPESPEMLHFHLDLPEGASLQMNGAGGADIIQGGEAIGLVAPPSAVDAQGSHVPVELSTDGATVTISVPHRDRDFAYPILVDPAISEWAQEQWYWGNLTQMLSPSIWAYDTNDPTEKYILHDYKCLTSALCSPSGKGLFISTLNRNIPPGVYAQWYYTVPGQTTYIPSIYPEYSAYLYPFFRNNEGCSYNQYTQPHDYDGAFSPTGWTWLETDRAQWVGSATIFTKAQGLAFGMNSGGGVNIPCWRNIMLGGIVIRLDDPEAPTLTTPTGFPSGWINGSKSFTAAAGISDPGLGIRNVVVYPSGRPSIPFTSPGSECPGTKLNPCPPSVSASFNLSAGLFDEGEKKVEVSGYDPTGKVSSTYTTQMKVDRTAPDVTLSGQLAVATEETEGDGKDPEKWDPLSLPVYNLTIAASDGSLASGESKRSGVKSVELQIDGKALKSWTQSCPNSSCPMTQTYPVQLNDLSADAHHVLKVITKDQVENVREREIEFEYIPATGIKDAYVLQRFPLPDGKDHTDEEVNHGPELAVNVMNGNLVYHERDVDIEGPNVDLEVERFYNSMQPSEADTQWGDGWSLAQTPQLDAVGGAGTLLGPTGVFEGEVDLPVGTSEERFDPQLQAVVTKNPDGSYAVADRSGESDVTTVFNPGGQTTEMQTAGPASIEYGYEAGDLSEIAVEDPNSSSTPPPVPPEIPAAPPAAPAYTSAFGTSGAGNGQFSHPADIARDASGKLWVVDENNNRLEQFTSGGEYVAKFGSVGSGNGQFNRPTAVAAAKGKLFVTDAGNKRVEIFSESGAFLKAFGSAGTGNGQFSGSGPEGIAVDASGNIWVSDTYGGRVQKFSEGGAFIKALGTKGSGSGQLGEPTSLDVGPDGKVWITDWQNNRVAVFSEAGEFVRQFGSEGAGNGQFNRPDAINIDSRGVVRVGDQNNGRIQAFNQNGEYVAQFGSKGTGVGQFSFSYPMGLTSDSRGHFWIADTNNNRIQKWTIPNYIPDYTAAAGGSFGSAGSGNGQFNLPGDIALDPSGNLWITDTNNNRIEKFNSSGTYLSKFGSLGSGNGQLNRPASIAVDASGNLWVADANNNRIQKFNSKGEFLLKVGSLGTGNGAFSAPEGIAIGPEGNLWVADTKNGRLQVFNDKGEFLRVVGAKGSAPGQLLEPLGLAFGPSEELFVADWGNNRIDEFNRQGEFISSFGTEGSAAGQLLHPAGIDVDARGVIWVTDSGNSRIQLFDEAGAYISQFGTKGSGAGQFSLDRPAGVVADSASGRTWITDANNGRVQKWVTPAYQAEEQALQAAEEPNDPAVQIGVSSGLVSSVDGAGAGENDYDYSGDDLVSHDGPEGEARFEYDAGGRMSKVMLPNGTFATIKYDATYHRAIAVTVDPEGAEPAKTTNFSYSLEPRRTSVEPQSAPVVTYDIGVDGSVLKSSNVVKPPELIPSGTLWVNRETAAPIATGLHNLEIQAHSQEGIASIEVIAGGNVVVSEQTCSQTEAPGIECQNETSEWVVETGSLQPGIIQLEALVEDRLGGISSQRFWVNVPYTPPPPPGEPAKPTFSSVKQFRLAYGLDLDLNPATEQGQLNNRIYDLLNAWNNPQTPEGQVARSSAERWGVPLRPVDVAEMEYREWYVAIDGPLIQQWAEQNYPNTYAGYFVDHPAGGVIRIGFTSEQGPRVASLISLSGTVADDRLGGFSQVPAHAVSELTSLQAAIGVNNAQEGALAGLIFSVGIDLPGNRVTVGTSSVAAVEGGLKASYGAAVPMTVRPEAPSAPQSQTISYPNRWTDDGPLVAGQVLAEKKGILPNGEPNFRGCTAAFGAWERTGSLPTGAPKVADFVITAGHCFSQEHKVFRFKYGPEPREFGDEVGEQRSRKSEPSKVQGEFEDDIEAVRLSTEMSPPTSIVGGGPVKGVAALNVGETVCFSWGFSHRVKCEPVTEPAVVRPGYAEAPYAGPFWVMRMKTSGINGDSGSPVYSPSTHAAVGIHVAGPPAEFATLLGPPLPEVGPYPYLHPTRAQAPGALKRPFMGPDLHISSK